MKRYLAVSAGLLVAGCLAAVLAVLVFPIVNAGSANAAQRTDSVLTIHRCTIKLIDHVTLACDRPGILAFVEHREGLRVAKAQTLAGLQEEIAQAALAKAKEKARNDISVRYAASLIKVSQAELEVALDTNRRVPRAVPEVEINRLRLNLEKANLQEEQARHDFVIAGFERDEAVATLKTFHVEAPFDGVVTKVYKKEGEAVRQGDPVVEMVSTRRVRVEGYINVRDVYSVKEGDLVRVQLDIPDNDLAVEKEVFEGKIVFVDVKVEPVTNEVLVWAEVGNKETPDKQPILRAGLTAKMTVSRTPLQAAARPTPAGEK